MQAAYNALGQLTDLRNTLPSGLISEFGSLTQSSGIRHDAAGNITSVPAYVPAASALSGTTSYAYDNGLDGGRSQVTQETSARGGGFTNAFSYDVSGNPISLRGVAESYSPDNQALMPLGDNPAFASSGNGNPVAARGHALAFDPENRLTGVADLAAGVATAVGVGPDNVLRQLENNNDGSISILNISLGNGAVNSALHPSGPISDWTCTALSVGADSQPRVLWSRSDGQMAVWTVNSSGGVTSTSAFGPYAGLTCTRLAVGPDNKPRVLWINASGQASVWTINSDNSVVSTPGYGPIAGWSCKDLAVGPDGKPRLLWVRTSDGQVSVWTINADNSVVSTPGYGPIFGWSCRSLAVGADNLTRLLWVRTSDSVFAMWTLNADGSVTSTSAFTPTAGYVPVNLSLDGYGVGRLLLSDGLGDSQIVDILPDNTSSGVLMTYSVGHIAGTGEASGYRGDGLRAWKQTDAGTRTYYLYDGSNPVCELNSSGSVTATNVFGANGLAWRNTYNGTVFYAFDERGNVAHRVTSSGSVTSSDLYDAFGKPRSGASDVFGFGGQAGYYTDTETGLVLCTNRHYDPQSGRFLSRDPLGYAGGINLYSYTANNPINRLDPTGLDFYSGLHTFWASFPTLLGAIGGIGGDFYHDDKNNVTVVSGGWAAYLLNKGGWGAITLGEVIITPDPANLSNIYNHELGHVDQARVLGPLFPILYPVGTVIGWARGDYHDANPFEVDADVRAGLYNKYNDTRPWGWGGADPSQPKHIGPTSCPL